MSEVKAPLGPLVYLLGCPPEVWLMRSKQSPDPAGQNFIEWPIKEAKLCGVARQHGLWLDRLRNDSGYRL